MHRKRQRDDGARPGTSASHVQQLQRCGDGRWMVISMAQRKQYERFVTQVLRRPDILQDPRGARSVKRPSPSVASLTAAAAASPHQTTAYLFVVVARRLCRSWVFRGPLDAPPAAALGLPNVSNVAARSPPQFGCRRAKPFVCLSFFL